MKILYITAEGFDTPNPNNQMAEVMIRDFLDNGHTVHLVQSHRKGINEDIPASLENRDGFSCDTVIRNVVDKTRFLKRYFNDTLYAFKSIRCGCYLLAVQSDNYIFNGVIENPEKKCAYCVFDL